VSLLTSGVVNALSINTQGTHSFPAQDEVTVATIKLLNCHKT